MMLACLLLLLTASRVCLTALNSTDQSRLELGEPLQHHSLPNLKRDTRPKCSLEGYLAGFGDTPSTSERDTALPDGSNSTAFEKLVRRTMKLPKDSMYNFFTSELVPKNFKPIVWGDNTRDGFCTALFEDIGGNKAKSLAAQGLCGCTVLIVASRTGVYMAHYFENMAFDPDQIWLDEWNTPEECFNANVIQGLTNGVPAAPRARRPRQVSLTSNAAAILAGAGPDGDKVKGYLIYPSGSSDGEATTYAGYQEKFLEIKKTVGEIIPPLAILDDGTSNPLWTDIPYDALNNDDEALGNTAAGKLIFKYDPSHVGQKKAALWVESDLTDRHNDQWT